MSDLNLKRLMSMADRDGVGQKIEQLVTKIPTCISWLHQATM